MNGLFRFNSSQVGYKRRYIVKILRMNYSFNSSQVGYKQTIRILNSIAVSVFQFLIGWLQTNFIKKQYGIGRKFQFLIGWLQTYVTFIVRRDNSKFQFLIGWLQTSFILEITKDKRKVSIPHRLATNSSTNLSNSSQNLCFNSSQVGYKRNSFSGTTPS